MAHALVAPMRRRILASFAIAAACWALACDDADGPDTGAAPNDEWGMEGPLVPTPAPGKEDSEHRRGLLVNADTRRTQVWTARNRWEDIGTAAALQPGLAWGAASGLTWDEKYAR